MARIVDAIVPPRANNDYRGGAVAFYGFCFLVAERVFSATVHFLTPDGGKNSIASIIVFEGDPDPNNIISLCSALGGIVQVLFVMLYGVVLWRYRNLIPLMFAFMIVESCFGFVVGTLHPLDPLYYEHTPPGKLAKFPKLLFGVLMLFLSVRGSIRGRER